MPSSRWSVAISSRIWAWIVTSSAVVGSSAISSCGSQASAIAIITRWRMPPESWCGYCVHALLGRRDADPREELDRARARDLARRRRGAASSASADLLAHAKHRVQRRSSAPGRSSPIVVAADRPQRAPRRARAGSRPRKRISPALDSARRHGHEAQDRERGHRLAAARLAHERERLAGARARGRRRAPRAPGRRRSRTRRAGRGCRAERPLAAAHRAAPPQPRVQRVAQALADQVEREHHDAGSRRPGIDEQPGRVEEVAAAVGQDVPPARVRRLHAEAEEGERGLGQDGARPRRSSPTPAPARSRSGPCGGR